MRIWQPAFCNDISSHDWVITIPPVWENERPTYWNFTSASTLTYQSSSASYFASVRPTSNFAWIGASTLCQFSRWRRSAMLYFMYGSDGPPTTCGWWCEFRHQILDWSDGFGDIASFRSLQFGGFWGHFSQMVSLIILTPKGSSLGWITSFEL